MDEWSVAGDADRYHLGYNKYMKYNVLPQTTSRQLKTKKGFTLIEVLIVVGIIGLLASVVLSGLGSVRSRGRDARRAADLRQVQQGLELYYTRFQSYPDEMGWDDLEDELQGANIGITRISDDPICSGSGTCDDNYEYFSADNETYVLQALLEDRNSPLTKDSYDESYSGSRCGTTRGDRFYYCIKF